MGRTLVTASLRLADRPLATASATGQVISLVGTRPFEDATPPEHRLYFSSDIVHEGRNGNGDIFTRQELERSWRSLVGKPLDCDHDMKVPAVVGQLYAARYDIVEGRAVVRVAGYIHQVFFPQVAWVVRNGIVNGISMECLFKSGQRTMQGRHLEGVNFVGAGIVRIPADGESLIDTVQESVTNASRRDLIIRAATEAALLQRTTR
jgi:hypothetical protein